MVVEPRVGFGGVFHLGHAFPIEVDILNSGVAVEGRLTVQVWKGGATRGGALYPIRYHRELFLAARSRKTVQLTVDPDFISRPLIITFDSAQGRSRREIDLRKHFSPTPVMLLLSETGLFPAFSLSATSRNRLVGISLAQLSADPRALLGVSHVIVYDQSLRDLSRSQYRALDTWLTNGGRMIIVGSLNHALYREASMSRFLPVRVTGVRKIAIVPSALRVDDGAPLEAWVQTSEVLQGTVIAHADGVPLQVEKSHGRGRITYVAADIGRPPLSQWPGLSRYFQAMLAATDGNTGPSWTPWSDNIFSQLIATPAFLSTYVPSGALFIAILGYMSLMATLTWLWQSHRIDARMAFFGMLGVIVVTTAVGFVHFDRGGDVPDGVLFSSSLIEDSGDGYMGVQSNLALFSTQVRDYQLQPAEGWTELTQLANRFGKPPENVEVWQGAGGDSRFQLPLREWDYKLMRMRSVERLPLQTSFELKQDRLVVQLMNHSNKDLYDCRVVLPGTHFSLGGVERGAQWRREFPLKMPSESTDGRGGIGERVSFREITFNDKTRDLLFHSSLFPRDGSDERFVGDVAVLFCWVQQPAPPARVDDPRIQGKHYMMFRAMVSLARGEDE